MHGTVERPAVLTPKEERHIVHALKKLAVVGAVQGIVMDYLRSAERQTPFKDGKPGPDWMRSFEKRWQNELTRRIGQPLPVSKAYSLVVGDFFHKLSSAFERLDLASRPQNIFNCDETGFQTDIGAQKVFCERGLSLRQQRPLIQSRFVYQRLVTIYRCTWSTRVYICMTRGAQGTLKMLDTPPPSLGGWKLASFVSGLK